MITEIVKEANLTGAKEEKLPYPMGIPHVCDVLRSEPAKVVAVGYDEYGLIIYSLLE